MYQLSNGIGKLKTEIMVAAIQDMQLGTGQQEPEFFPHRGWADRIAIPPEEQRGDVY